MSLIACEEAIFESPIGEHPKKLGQIQVKGERDCEGSRCILLTVSCDNIEKPMNALVKLKTVPNSNGTVVFTTGGDGTRLFDEINRTGAYNDKTKVKFKEIIEKLKENRTW